MKQNIKIVGDVGKVKGIELTLKEIVMAKTQPDVTPREQPQTKHDTEQVLGPRPRQTYKNNELNNLELLSEIKRGGSRDMRNPLEVVTVGDGTAILVDEELKYLQRNNAKRNIEYTK